MSRNILLGGILLVCIILILSSWFTLANSNSGGNGGRYSNTMCEVTGTCITCRKEEMDNEYCKETGKRIRIRCKDGSTEFDDYKSCMKTAEDAQIEVIMFQIACGVIGGLAYWGVQSRKKFSMSSFDHRKQQR
jgi:hypothetical protein